MLRSMYSGISGMKVNQTKLDVIGNNIANVSTTAFKSSNARFSDMIYQSSSAATSPTSTKGGTNAKQVGLGAQLSSINKVMSQGNALSTGRSLDVCIDGEGYLIVGSGLVDYTDAKGVELNDTNGIADSGGMSINYTRDGNLVLDKDGNLLTADGYRVMGYLLSSTPKATAGGNAAGDPTGPSIDDDGKVQYVDADGDLKASREKLYPLQIPDSVIVKNADGTTEEKKVASFTIGKDGVITAILADGSRSALGQIATATFKNPEGLTSVGGNLLQVSTNSGSETIRSAVGTDENKDNSNAYGDFIQGCLEASNVDITEQFTDMITATRAFQASSKMISNADEILQTITGLIR
ncbi:flagellar hook-basal body complex protein [Clostridium sp. SM-530-WT-3G]|uniref:flagellar hook-basal body complex protein n=1 Tax=Clostridium sp. SM-530-WT-3G TaxID=2725303 RepID=UPI00145CE73E|nr:flagellar hook-basal body complex protein [Clostridium sp. SM-530-WT-3G]NME82765.1 flagellar hook-basal body complex protein [Clostridium sp. SM-530-WT-3G]